MSSIAFAECPSATGVRLPTLRNHIRMVLSGAAEPQMRRIAALGIVTAMAYKHALGNWAIGKHPNQTMSPPIPMPAIGAFTNYAIPFAVGCGRQPGPTLVGAALVDLLPKACCDRASNSRMGAAIRIMAGTTTEETITRLAGPHKEFSSALKAGTGDTGAGCGRMLLHGESPFAVPRSRPLIRCGSTLLSTIIAQMSSLWRYTARGGSAT